MASRNSEPERLFELVPGIGLADLKLGSSIAEVERWVAAQKCDFVRKVEDDQITLESANLRLEIELDDSESGGGEWRLWLVGARSECAQLLGRAWVGRGEVDIRRVLGDPSECTRHWESGFVHMYYAEGALETCWFYLPSGRVEEFSVGPRYTPDGRSALWP